MSIPELVDHFLTEFVSKPDYDAVAEFEGVELRSSIEIACRSVFEGKMHSHQCCVPSKAMRDGETVLIRMKDKIEGFEKFHQLFSLIDVEFSKIAGAGEFYRYDVAHRIGRSIGLEPEYVYLHRGTRDGARHFWKKTKENNLKPFNINSKYVQSCLISPELVRLTPAQAEDFLCIYKDCIAPVLAGEPLRDLPEFNGCSSRGGPSVCVRRGGRSRGGC